MMNVECFVGLGKRIRAWLDGRVTWPELDAAVSESERTNPYFTELMQRKSLESICEMYLDETEIRKWLSCYDIAGGNGKKKRIGVVMAGNIPLVGFLDLFCVLISGNEPLVKLSSKDPYLMRVLFPDVRFLEKEEFMLSEPDALITMGGDAAASYFDKAFGGIPRLIRRSRFSIAFLDGSESYRQLLSLADDMLLYYGLGCRSVTRLMLPAGYDYGMLTATLREKMEEYGSPFFEKMYRRSRALLSMQGADFHDTGSFLLVRSADDDVQIACANCLVYSKESEAEDFFVRKSEQIQKLYRTFGSAQRPSLSDYPDGEDVMAFILNI